MGATIVGAMVVEVLYVICSMGLIIPPPPPPGFSWPAVGQLVHVSWGHYQGICTMSRLRLSASLFATKRWRHIQHIAESSRLHHWSQGASNWAAYACRLGTLPGHLPTHNEQTETFFELICNQEMAPQQSAGSSRLHHWLQRASDKAGAPQEACGCTLS